MRRIRKCFKSGNAQVVLRALDLTDILMQACGLHARREVASDKFLKQIGKLCKVGGSVCAFVVGGDLIRLCLCVCRVWVLCWRRPR